VHRDPNECPILIQGPVGSGKTFLGEYIHANSPRRAGPWQLLNANQYKRNSLFRTELLGYVKGAFTGADKDKSGYMDEVNDGYFMLDEVSDLSYEDQGLLLELTANPPLARFSPVGATSSRLVNVRFIFGSNKDLRGLVREGLFREDLLSRISAPWLLRLESLRERPEDIEFFWCAELKRLQGSVREALLPLSSEHLEVLKGFSWPSNLRQLARVASAAFAALMVRGDLDPEDLELLARAVHDDGHGGEPGLPPLGSSAMRSLKSTCERLFVSNPEDVKAVRAALDKPAEGEREQSSIKLTGRPVGWLKRARALGLTTEHPESRARDARSGQPSATELDSIAKTICNQARSQSLDCATAFAQLLQLSAAQCDEVLPYRSAPPPAARLVRPPSSEGTSNPPSETQEVAPGMPLLPGLGRTPIPSMVAPAGREQLRKLDRHLAEAIESLTQARAAIQAIEDAGRAPDAGESGTN